MGMQPKVQLINVMDNRAEAWTNSRPTFNSGDLEVESALSMDMAFNSLCMMSFKITSSMYFRDFLFTIRPLYAWAMSSRDIEFNTDNLQISSECSWGQEGVSRALELTRQGLHQNICRQELPMTLSTTYVINMDFRTVCGLIKSMQILDPKLFEAYGKLFIDQVESIKGYRDNVIKEFSESYLISDDELEDANFETSGDMIYGSRVMNVALAAQFLRQSQSKIKTSIWNDIFYSGYACASKKYQDNISRVVYYIPKNIYHSLMRNRSHWFADWRPNMWGGIIGDYIKDMTTKEFWEFTPSGNGRHDPYYYHTLKRIQGDDLNSPCPIALEHPELVYDRFSDQGENPIVNKYLDLVKEGYIKDNPNNKNRIQYTEMLNDRRNK